MDEGVSRVCNGQLAPHMFSCSLCGAVKKLCSALSGVDKCEFILSSAAPLLLMRATACHQSHFRRSA